MSFDSYDLPINLPAVDRFRGRGHEHEELTLNELVARGLWRRRQGKDRLAAEANLHFRLVEVVMMLMLPLLAVALAVPPKRSTSSLGIFVGIVIVVAYHKVNQYAEQAGAAGADRADPRVVAAASCCRAMIWWMYHVLAHRPGGQPIGALERAFAKLGQDGRARSCPDRRSGGMINLDFLPSRRLALYTVRLFLTRSLAVLVALVLVLMTLDLLGESGKILAVPGNGEAELWRYVSLRVPLLISRFLPFSVLLGTLIAFAGLNQHSEVVAMKAAGMSAHQILAPLIVASLGIAAVAVRLQRDGRGQGGADGDRLERQRLPADPARRATSCPTSGSCDGDDLVRARHVGRPGRNGCALPDVTIYDREGGALRQVIDADRARPARRRLAARECADLRCDR